MKGYFIPYLIKLVDTYLKVLSVNFKSIASRPPLSRQKINVTVIAQYTVIS